MPWIEKKKNWLPGRKQQRPEPEILYTVAEVAEIMGVDRQTVIKWLSFDDPEAAIIPPEMWFKLPGGHIRIRKKVIDNIMKGLKT